MSESDEHGHRWLATRSPILAPVFPLVCGRCLVRNDRTEADQPCDAAFEQIVERRGETSE